jgi:hypothetical protein
MEEPTPIPTPIPSQIPENFSTIINDFILNFADSLFFYFATYNEILDFCIFYFTLQTKMIK